MQEFIANGSGFGMQFPNGYRISIRWGPDNLCQHKGKEPGGNQSYFDAFRRSNDAEVQVYNPRGELVPLHEGVNRKTVGYMSPAMLSEFSFVVSKCLNDGEVARGLSTIISKKNIESILKRGLNAKLIGLRSIPERVKQD